MAPGLEVVWCVEQANEPNRRVEEGGVERTNRQGSGRRRGGWPLLGLHQHTRDECRSEAEGLRQEVKRYNIRTTVISPGAIATDLPGSVTEPDIASAVSQFYREYAISPGVFARAVAFAIEQPDDVDVNEILFRPTRQES